MITDALTNRHLELIYNLARRASAPLPSGEPTSEAVAWRSRIICLDEIIAIVEREYTGYESDVERIKDALSSLREVALRSAAFAHPLPSDAPSGAIG